MGRKSGTDVQGSFARRLSAWMTVYEVGDRALAKRLDVDVSTVCRWRTGDTRPHADQVEAIAKALGIDSVAEFYGAPRTSPGAA